MVDLIILLSDWKTQHTIFLLTRLWKTQHLFKGCDVILKANILFVEHVNCIFSYRTKVDNLKCVPLSSDLLMFYVNVVYYVPPLTEMWGHVGLPLSARLSPANTRRWPKLVQCWLTVCYAGTASNQHWFNASCLLGLSLSQSVFHMNSMIFLGEKGTIIIEICISSSYFL